MHHGLSGDARRMKVKFERTAVQMLGRWIPLKDEYIKSKIVKRFSSLHILLSFHFLTTPV